jgi:hypothetical protein
MQNHHDEWRGRVPANRTSRVGPLGDPVPPILGTYYDLIDANRFVDAAETFAPAGRYAGPLPGAIETAPRAQAVGPAGLARLLEQGPKGGRHVVQLCLSEGRDCLLEGQLVDDAGAIVATFVASAQLGDSGLVERYLSFQCPRAVDAIPDDVSTTPNDALIAVLEYFDDLDSGRFAGAAARFSDNVSYSHPPYKHTGISDPDRIEFRGRRELLAGFERRGAASFEHDVLVAIQRGPHCIFEGAVRNTPGGGTGSFISSLSLARDGTIRRYVSFYCEPGVPR